MICLAKREVTFVPLFEYDFEICFRESGFDLEIPSLRVKSGSRIFLLQKMVLIEFATKATRNGLQLEKSGLRKGGEALWHNFGKDAGRESMLYWHGISTPQLWT